MKLNSLNDIIKCIIMDISKEAVQSNYKVSQWGNINVNVNISLILRTLLLL